MKKQPIFILTMAFALGIFFQDKVVLLDKTIFILLIFTFLLQFLFLLKNQWIRRGKVILLGIFFFSIGIFAHSIHQEKRKFNFDENQLYQVSFKLEKILKSNAKYRRYQVAIFTDNTKVKVLLHLPKNQPRLDFMHFYQMQLKIREVPSPLNDYNFDYQKYLTRQGIFYQSYGYSEINITDKKSISWRDFLRQKRENLLFKIEISPLSSATKTLMKSLVLADKTEMNPTFYDSFKRSGMVHVLAISGMHIAILFGFFYWIFNRIFSRKKWTIIGSLAFIWLFAIFIGLGNSVFRACLMLTIYFTFDFLQHKRDFLHTWSLAMLVILVINTQQLFDIGFQLSFSAVLGIFWLYPPIFNLFPKLKLRGSSFIFGVISVTFSAQLTVLPFVLYYFHGFSLVGILVNIFLIPLMQILVVLSFIILILLPFSSFLEPIIKLYDIGVQYVLKVINFCSKFHWAYFENIPFHFLEVLLGLIILYLLRFVLKNFSSQNSIKLSYAILLFIVARWGLNFYYQNIDEVKIHRTYSERVISIKNGGKLTFYLQTDNNHKVIKRVIIQPYLLKIRTLFYEVKLLSTDCKSIIFKDKKYDF